MVSQARKLFPDQDQRDAAIAERERNVFVDAGVGIGKTMILVDRFVEMVAPIGGVKLMTAVGAVSVLTGGTLLDQ